MNCRYCADYIKRAHAEVADFERACQILKLDPRREEDFEAIIKALSAIGQFGAIRLARRYPWVKDESDFHLVTIVGLHFYWMTLDFWEEIRAQQAKQRADGSLSSAQSKSLT